MFNQFINNLNFSSQTSNGRNLLKTFKLCYIKTGLPQISHLQFSFNVTVFKNSGVDEIFKNVINGHHFKLKIELSLKTKESTSYYVV